MGIWTGSVNSPPPEPGRRPAPAASLVIGKAMWFISARRCGPGRWRRAASCRAACSKGIPMTFRAILGLSLALLAAPAWAQTPAKPAKPAAASDPVVARVNGSELHRSDVVEAIRGLPPQVQQQPMDRLYPALLDQMVGTMLVSQAGRKSNLQDDPEVRER